MRRVHISQLVSPCITRARGEEAGEKLQRYTDVEHIEVDLGDIEMVSLSFLDGLISHFLRLGREQNIVFQIDTPTLEDKLARVAGIRHAIIYYRYGEREIQQAEPKLIDSHKATFMVTKDALRR